MLETITFLSSRERPEFWCLENRGRGAERRKRGGKQGLEVEDDEEEEVEEEGWRR